MNLINLSLFLRYWNHSFGDYEFSYLHPKLRSQPWTYGELIKIYKMPLGSQLIYSPGTNQYPPYKLKHLSMGTMRILIRMSQLPTLIPPTLSPESVSQQINFNMSGMYRHGLKRYELHFQFVFSIKKKN